MPNYWARLFMVGVFGFIATGGGAFGAASSTSGSALRCAGTMFGTQAYGALSGRGRRWCVPKAAGPAREIWVRDAGGIVKTKRRE